MTSSGLSITKRWAYPLVQGRGFTEQDRKGAPGVVIINEAMARRFFAGQNAVGKRLSLNTGGTIP
ncbi:MAG: ABC transporter permease [Pyrinomonadaceae bacterium]